MFLIIQNHFRRVIFNKQVWDWNQLLVKGLPVNKSCDRTYMCTSRGSFRPRRVNRKRSFIFWTFRRTTLGVSMKGLQRSKLRRPKSAASMFVEAHRRD